MRIVLFIVFVFPFLAFGQSLLNDLEISTGKNNVAVSAYSDVFYQSQGLSNDFLGKFIFGGNIDTDLKNKIEAQLTDEKNRFGVGISSGIKFYDVSDSLMKNLDWGIAIGIEHHSLTNASFTRDLFHAVFIGNADRIGQDLNMGPTSFNSTTFQELGFSLVNKPKGHEFGVSIIKGQSNQSLKAKTLTLNTASDVSTLTLETNGTLITSDSSQSNVNIMTMNGIGAAVNVIYYIPIGKPKESFSSLGKDSGKKPELASLRIGIDNLGFVSWYRNPATYTSDTTYSFSGYEIENLFDNDYTNWFDQQELKDSILPQATYKNYYTLLPAVFTVSFIPNFKPDKKLYGIAGGKYQINANARPVFYGGLQYVVNKSFSGSLIGIVGGYGDITAGVRVKYSSNNIAGFVSCNNLPGLIFKNAYGKNLNLGMICRF